jgi:hypothetical protein
MGEVDQGGEDITTNPRQSVTVNPDRKKYDNFTFTFSVQFWWYSVRPATTAKAVTATAVPPSPPLLSNTWHRFSYLGCHKNIT